ncbi:DedA family protein [Brevibacillus centrosporus]|uniref:DedA family protein n=1 Tax=Brevibacillus centrosporus TaxID=54910 RepID=UPI002E1ACDCC|nr:VTT domain-containing protein [Brevibacillus centrosporus]
MVAGGFISSFVSVVKEMASKLIPDEIIVITAGAQVTHSEQSVGQAFLSVYLAAAFVLTFCYILGAILRTPVAGWLRHRRQFPFISSPRGHQAMNWILCLSIFFPVVRHVVPFLAGMFRFRLRHFLLVFLPSSFLWTLHYFLAGYWMSDKIDLLVAGIYRYSKISLVGLLIVVVLYALVRHMIRWGSTGTGEKNRREYS